MSISKQVTRRPKAVEDVEAHALYIAGDNIDAALRFLERAEQTIKGLALFPESGGLFQTDVPELVGVRTRLVKDFPDHVVFYIDRPDSIEVIRVLRGGQDMSVEITEP